MTELRAAVETGIRTAFAGVHLGDGISLKQARSIDDHRMTWSGTGYKLLPDTEVTQDWSRVPLSELERDSIWHLDGEGVRFYLPALMLHLLDGYDDTEMWVIGTIQVLVPDDRWSEMRLALFSDAQRAATAAFVEALPQLVDLNSADRVALKRALGAYWGQFLPSRDSR